MTNDSEPRVVEATKVASIEDVREGDLLRWQTPGGYTVGRVATVKPSADGLGVDLTFAAEATS